MSPPAREVEVESERDTVPTDVDAVLAVARVNYESNLSSKLSGSSIASKQGKVLFIPKGRISDEMLFEVIALMSTAVGMHAKRVISGFERMKSQTLMTTRLANMTDDTRALSDEMEWSPEVSSPPVSLFETDPGSPSDATEVLDFEGDEAPSDSDSAQEVASTPDLASSYASNATSAASTAPPSTPGSPTYYPAPVSSNGTGTPPPGTPPTGSLSPASEASSEDDLEEFEEDVVGAIHRLSAMTNAASED
ncbi:SubName: Full=Uncharacterized protein {ECO:0000313/EMBL:CCA75033.1} [Serendipita indica DSM 11827]|uniref:Uncharacterized protein n=1 Tax=Serendipita indica (strain DSM 11827) TaxID=1109443 RepID=G4TUP0_SERID|nr:SubName: Full=Uncharacterized protein {ECO:0000313/EMBL:CCA75033.1} [Serendipita indica DSM 11827]CCA75033.1 hypothetical protein PIIN_09018 [Serendipita indica DSM 11827]